MRRLASARHAPARLIQRARIITSSWDGASVAEIAQSSGCHPKTVSKWPHRFNQTHGLQSWLTCPARAKGRTGGGPAHGRPAPTRSSSQRAQVIACYTTPPPEVTVVCQPQQLLDLYLATGSSPHSPGVHPQGRLPAESAGGLVAAVSPRSLCQAVICQPRRDHAGHQDGDLSAECPRPTVGVGPPSTVPTSPTPRLHLPHLRNTALGIGTADGWVAG
jgi:Homeodomain-like domain